VVEGQRLMQAASDIFLGWVRLDEGLDGKPRDFYIRQLWDWKSSADLETINPSGLVIYARVCGWTLARAHARSGDRIAIGSYLGSGDRFDRAVSEFATAYADLNERDYEALMAAKRSGRIAVDETV
jgi:predicted alpha/beta hydrolase